jgi:hypothetical protein
VHLTLIIQAALILRDLIAVVVQALVPVAAHPLAVLDLLALLQALVLCAGAAAAALLTA